MKLLKNGLLSVVLATSLFASGVSQNDCNAKGEDFIWASDECVNLYIAEGEREGMLNIVVHGTWKKGTNTLGRYSPFADDINMGTDITTVAVALPGYSKSSSNKYDSLKDKNGLHYSSQKEYIEFMTQLIENLKKRFDAKTITYIGHSAAASMGATIVGYKPNLIQNLVAAGGKYDIYNDKNKEDKNLKKGLWSAVKFIDTIPKDTKLILVYGTKDDISYPKFSKSFHDKLKSKGINSSLVEVKDGVHLDLDMSDPSKEAITALLEE
jgi:predicted esterase